MIKKFLTQIYTWYCNTRKKMEREWYTFKIKEQASKVGIQCTVNGPSSVNSNTRLGDNVNFNGLHVRGDGELSIGDNFHSGPDVRILTRNHNYDNGDAIPYDNTYCRHPVHIEDNVWIGVGTTILPGINIGEGAIVQAGSTVVSDVPPGAIVGGHPAEKFSQRDMDHYNELKDDELFH